MVEFDSLPQNSRLLILATLELEIASENCKSIFDLARKRFQTIDQVWRDVCKKTSLPRCTMPPRVMGNDYAGGTASNVIVYGDASANASVFGGARTGESRQPHADGRAGTGRKRQTRHSRCNGGANGGCICGAGGSARQEAESGSRHRRRNCRGVFVGYWDCGVCNTAFDADPVRVDRHKAERNCQARRKQADSRPQRRADARGNGPSPGCDQQIVLQAVAQDRDRRARARRRGATTIAVANRRVQPTAPARLHRTDRLTSGRGTDLVARRYHCSIKGARVMKRYARRPPACC